MFHDKELEVEAVMSTVLVVVLEAECFLLDYLRFWLECFTLCQPITPSIEHSAIANQ